MSKTPFNEPVALFDIWNVNLRFQGRMLASSADCALAHAKKSGITAPIVGLVPEIARRAGGPVVSQISERLASHHFDRVYG